MSSPLRFPLDTSLASVAAAYAARDAHLYPAERPAERRARMRRQMLKLGWCTESEAEWHRRVQQRASEVLMQSPPEATVEDIWHEARRGVPRRRADPRAEAVLAALDEGMPPEQVYAHFFTLDDLTFLGW